MVVQLTDLVVLPLSRQAIAWAVRTATQKIIQTDRGFVRRGLAQILQNTFQGDLAKKAFIEWLQSRGITNIWDYDHVRPHFRAWNRLGYQMKVTQADSHEVTIDVNSSIPPHDETDQEIIDNYDIKVTAGSRRGQLRDPLNLRSEVFVQIYVRPRVGLITVDPTAIRTSLLEEETRAARRILQISRAYTGDILTGFAWATRNDIDGFNTEFQRNGVRTTWQFWRRIYWRCPIGRSRPLRDLMQYLT